ncbi:MAG: Crp/Fnr family transcriptional regulator [Candidatus Angelobacter sp.]
MSPPTESRNGYKNRILASLPKAEIFRLSLNLSPLDLPSGKTLMDPGQETTYAYFLETGLASVVVAMADGNMVETGITGNDGLVGFPALLGTKTTPTRTFMQIPGNGFRIKAQYLINEFERSGTLRKKINRYFQAHLVQTGQTAACNRLHDITQRLARWLLMCHDRMEADTFTITHEFLGHMLGTPRSTVTLAAGILHKAGLIDYSRGKIIIRDRKGLEKSACECYQTIKNEFDRLGISSA